ncbi:disulfide bond formation protein B [Streptomyces bohaiensis]|uniref:Disulfide bond formation protein B n=1 Tax=Streptomyces bohaiensis TaxID=1431344 RepID=A0ABX1CCP9_9ACTN|nr:disulfide bond formation protein B [Streptomyces bohaiensis]NJQ16883.1 disulfide bond formation protein B [Streptomyces bohaiensis]
MAVLIPDRLAQTGERPAALETGQYWFACCFVLGWSGALAAGLYYQFATGHLPCALSVLQRVFMVLALLAAAQIVRRGLAGGLSSRDHMRAWGMALVACVGGALVAGRQTMLHVIPGDPGFAGRVLGLHLYVWALLLFLAAILVLGLVMTVAHRTGEAPGPVRGAAQRTGWFVLVVAGAVIAACVVVTFAQQGFHARIPGDPDRYRLFYDLRLKG